MSALTDLLFKQRMRWYRRGIDRSHQLRRRLAYYVAKHGFEIGDYSVGAPTIRHYNANRLKIGKYSSVSLGATFIMGGQHPTQTVTTHLLEIPRGIGSAEGQGTRGDIVIGSDVWIAGNAIILSGVTIGDGAVVGAGSVVIDDVPPYTIVFGNPARVVRKRFSDDIVEQLLEVRWWDLDHAQVQSLRSLLLSEDCETLLVECRKLKGLSPAAKTNVSLEPKTSTEPKTSPEPKSAKFTVAKTSSRLSSADVLALIQEESPAVSAADLDRPFDEIDVDSFALLTLRTKLEEAAQTTIDDQVWSSLATPADIIRIFAGAEPAKARSGPTAALAERRLYNVNLPQMAVRGLSESWLFKEIGDLHWSLITKGLGASSSQLRDVAGNRLFATFTRFQLNSTAPMTAYAENEPIAIEAKISRYGAGMFFNDATLQGDGKSARVRLMSNFSKFDETVANTALLTGQPQIAADCKIPTLPDLPEFGQQYRAQRSVPLEPPIFECGYDIVASHDINGVGLLYFAAYPIINDICALRYAGPALSAYSTRCRDVFYFANCEADDSLIYRIHHWRASDDSIEPEESLSRKSDGTLMAYTRTTKDRTKQGAIRERTIKDRSAA